jgi:hypothetical protein
VQAAEVVVANTTASGLQEMEAQSKVTEHQVEMAIEVEMEMAIEVERVIEAAAATAIDLTPALFATLHRLQDHYPFADSLPSTSMIVLLKLALAYAIADDSASP